MTGKALPPKFGGMLSQFLEGWKRDQEWYELQHKEVLKNGEQRWWKPVRVAGFTQLIGTLESYPPTDNYLTAQKYPSSSDDHESPIIDRIGIDVDPASKEVHDLLDELPFYLRIQDSLRDERGRSPVVIIFSGRGVHLWIYLAQRVSMAEGQAVRDGIVSKYDIPADPKVQVEKRRMMRIPYTVNSRTGWNAVWVTGRMGLDDVRALAASKKSGCFWDPIHRVDAATLPHSYFGARSCIATQQRERLLRAPSSAGEGLWALLARRAREMKREGMQVDDIAVILRRTSSEVESMLSDG